MNPLDWSGPAFLQLYFTLALVALGITFYWRYALSSRRAGEALPELHPYELAHLVGGPARTIDTALAHLAEAGVVEFDENEKVFRKKEDLDRHAHPLEKSLVAQLSMPQTIATLRSGSSVEVGKIRERLERLRLEMTDREVTEARFFPLMPLVLLFVFGMMKFVLGIFRDRPVEILGFSSFILVVVICNLAARVSRLTSLGSALLASYQAKHASLAVAANKAPATLTGMDLTMAVCLFGPMVLAGGPLMGMQQIMHGNVTPGDATYGNGCGSSCGSSGSGCGGSSGGDGGGGGGGCGGCGGGGD